MEKQNKLIIRMKDRFNSYKTKIIHLFEMMSEFNIKEININ